MQITEVDSVGPIIDNNKAGEVGERDDDANALGDNKDLDVDLFFSVFSFVCLFACLLVCLFVCLFLLFFSLISPGLACATPLCPGSPWRPGKSCEEEC